MNTLLVMAGAAIGAPARYAIDQYLRRFTTKPVGTFTVNIVGSFFIGLTFQASTQAHDLLAIGFAGVTFYVFERNLWIGTVLLLVFLLLVLFLERQEIQRIIKK